MQLQLKLTPQDRQEATQRAQLKKTITHCIIGGAFALLFTFLVATTVLRYAGTTPPLLLAGGLLRNPFLWLLVLLAIVLFAGRGTPAQNQAAHLFGFAAYRPAFTCQITAEGIACYDGDTRLGAFTYAAFTGVHKTNHLLLIMQKQTVLFILPLRCFATPEQAQETETFLQNKLAQAQTQPGPLLAVEPQPSLWSFQYLADTSVALSAASIQAEQQLGSKRWRRLFWALAFCSFSILVLAMFVTPPLVLLPLFLTGMLALLFTTALARQKTGKLGSNLSWVPTCLYGACTLEVLPHGLRIYNTQMEMLMGWEQPLQTLAGPSMAIFTLHGTLFACLPYAAGPWHTVTAALQYIQAD
ncbi:YcxB family protein [Ruminococcaceae bacterium OttesenSCG-928-A16]|nr:YcxB family protein [Ruminococcaceae bacterium OttesenSCG-928-A16]